MSGTVVDLRLLFQTILICHSSAIILSHNHPSGNLQPSVADIDITKRVVEIAKLLEIIILDHMIITSGGYYSFSDEGLI